MAPTAFMRRNHFELIKHQRDITVHQGIRDTDDSLAGCVDCHVRKDAQGNHVPVNAAGEFCAGCHEYTGRHAGLFLAVTLPSLRGTSMSQPTDQPTDQRSAETFWAARVPQRRPSWHLAYSCIPWRGRAARYRGDR